MFASITIRQFEDAYQNHEGFCTQCGDFTAENVEPDAGEYKCPVCGNLTVYGAERAMLEEKFFVE